MKQFNDAITLAMPPEQWFLDLTNGEVLEVLTHGYSIEDGRYVFSLLFRGSPHFEVTVLSIPVSLVAEMR
jgi:hypothetical protein